MEQTEIYVKSSIDSSMQPSLFFKSKTKEKRPLLVGLHTWSYGRYNQIDNMLPYAEIYDFNLLLPEFRGSNLKTNPDCIKACGSEFAKYDIKDAIDYIIENENIDSDNIFLLGLSGGGHMSLLMAGFCPEYFKAIGAYVPISDLEKWSKQNPVYCEHVLACCSNDVDEMKKRSPLSYVDTISKANLKIFHGKFDSVVPVSQSLELYSEIMSRYPDSRVFLDVFDGMHEIDMETAIYWFMSQYKCLEKTLVTG